MDSRVLEITLISAQGLKLPPSSAALRRTPSFFAVAWADPAAKLRTRTDDLGGASPTWNDRFLFSVPAADLASDSPAAVSIDIYAVGAWCLPDTLSGSVRLLLANHHLLKRPCRAPVFVPLLVRRPSGRCHGVLNLAVVLLDRVPLLAAEALVARPAVAYRDLMGGGSTRIRHRSLVLPPPPPPRAPLPPPPPLPKDPAVLKERNREEQSDGRGALCGMGIRKIHLSPSDQNLQLSWGYDK